MLILTEKLSVAKDFADAFRANKFEGYFKTQDITITYCKGHLFELCPPSFYDKKYEKWNIEDLPIIPQKFCYEKIPAATKQAKIVLSLLKEHKTDKIIIATDADREGELIARTVLSEAGITDISNCRRFWVSEALTHDVIQAGLENAKPLSSYDELAQQAYARQSADWLVGINFTRFASAGNSEVFSVGRVQTAVLFQIALRNHQVKNFTPTPYWEMEVEITDRNGNKIKALLVNPETGKIRFDKKNSYFQAALTSLSGSRITSTMENSISKTERPPKLLNISALQKEAYKQYGYTPEKTLSIAESLYNSLKCLSYPRTPSRVMGDNNADFFLQKFDLLRTEYSKLSASCKRNLITQENKHIFNSKCLESHHALIPLSPLPISANTEEKNVFGIVLESFFTVCMDDYKYNEKSINFYCGDKHFVTSFHETLQPGWKVTCRNLTATNNSDIQSAVSFNEKNCSIASMRPLEKRTTSPKEYSIDTLLSFMEKPVDSNSNEKLVGLGTPATRAEIIQKLFSKGYIVEEKKKLHATEKALWLLSFLSKDRELSKIANVNQTTFWEAELNTNPALFEKHIKEYVASCIKPNLCESYSKEIPGNCPLCGKPVTEQKFTFSCSGWKFATPCQFKIWKSYYNTTISFDDAKALLSGNTTKTKNCKSKNGKIYKAKLHLKSDGTLEQFFVKPRTKNKD